MSRAAKTQLLALLETLQRANQVIELVLVSEKQEAGIQLLTECQECAITIGNKIEQIYGEGLQCVMGLETYCEMIYQISQSVEDIEHCKSLNISLQRQLDMVKSDMERELAEKKEVVFLPYKASMWDSLESVWKAAGDDEECNVYVIPIPYYDKNPDGSFGEEHYEGDLYPAYVPITRYDEYDFEMRRPEMIFIHNPYDDANYVTSVHPFFYSKNLKQFTDKLVYIPYFVLGEVNPKSKAIVDNMKHFCMTPGVVHANKVFVQSEDMRQIYVNVMTELAGKHTRGYWEEKISGIGSPKIDKVLSTGKEDVDVPEDWMKLIEKADGTWKKIVFYNTGIAAILQHEEQMLMKIADVLRIFKERKDEIVLLWRPHPLMKSTLESMRPELLERYDDIVAQYKTEKWGIYDDSADLNRAITISDAYYGDASSITELFRKVGKDIIVQNPYMTYDKLIKDWYWAEDFWVEGDYLYFTPFMYNVLCCYDLNKKRMEYVADIPAKNYASGLYNRIVKNKEKIILIPNYAKEICEYNTLTSEWRKYDIIDNQDETELFCGYAIWKDILYLFPQRYSKIVKLNLRTEEIAYISKWDSKDWQLQMDSCTVMNKVYMLIQNTNQILIYDMECEMYEIKTVGEMDEYVTICAVGKAEFYLTNKSGDIIIWNEYTGRVSKIVNDIRGFVLDRDMSIWGAFNSSVADSNYVYFFPGAANMVFRIPIGSLNSSEIEVIEENDFEKMIWKYSRYSRVKIEKGTIYGFDSVKREFLTIDNMRKDKAVFRIEVEEVEENKKRKWYQEFGRYVNIVPAEYYPSFLQLSHFLNCIEKKEKAEKKYKKTIGETIYLECRY